MKEWKSILLSLPDRVFFEIIRNYLGKVSSPYNKQVLVLRLENAFLDPAKRDLIFSLINQEDAQIMTAIEFMNSPDIKLLYRFFSDTWGLRPLESHLLNLEERLLIFSYKEGHTRRYQLFPLFREDLHKRILALSLVIPHKKITPRSWKISVDDNFIMAFLSLLNHKHSLILQKDNQLLQAEYAKEIFASLLRETSVVKLEQLARRVLSNSGLLRENKEGGWELDLSVWRWFETLSHQTRLLCLWAAGIAPDRVAMQELVKPLQKFLGGIPADRAFRRFSLHKVLAIIEPEFSFMPYGTPDRFLDALIQLNLLREDEENLLYLNGAVKDLTDWEPVLLQPNFEVVVKPCTPFSALLPSIAQVEKVDTYSSYHITKKSFLRGCSQGWTLPEIIKSFERITGRPLNQAMATAFRAWTEEGQNWCCYQGVVLTVSSNYRELVGQKEVLGPYVKAVLAPGVFLLSLSEKEKWGKILQDLEIFVPRALFFSEPETSQIPIIEEESLLASEILELEDWQDKPIQDDSKKIEAQLLAVCEKRNLGSKEKEVYRNRIKRKLVFLPDQIVPGAVHHEIYEAKGIDYQAKVHLIEKAISLKSDHLEFFLLGEEGKKTMRPYSLKGKGGEAEVLGALLPDEKEVSVKIKKISYLKRVRTSFF